MGLYYIIRINDRRVFGFRIEPLQCIVESACLKAGKPLDMKKAKFVPKLPREHLNGLPDISIFCVVINNKHLKMLILKRRKSFECLHQKRWRLVICRHEN